VRRARFALLILALFAVCSVALPGSALADGCNGSAGDTQYFDPLQPCNSQPPPTSGQTHSSGTTSTPSYPTATTAVASTTTKADPKSSKTLPFTGLDLGPTIVIALALLGGGVILRRLAIRGDTG
jgi:hypothetical protein